jgi:hypothetical protein
VVFDIGYRVQREDLTSAELFAEVERSGTFSAGEIAYFRKAAALLPGKWDVKVVTAGATPGGAGCVYFFHAGPATEALPIMAFFRTADGYMAVSWSFMVWLDDQKHEVVKCAVLGSLIGVVGDMISEDAAMGNDVSYSGVSEALPGVVLPTAGAFFPVLGGRS